MSELSPATIAQLPKLEGEASYQTWSLQIKATAQCGGFWGPFIGDNKPAGSDAADIDRAAQREQKACGLMLKHWGRGGLETGDYMLGTFRAHVHLSHNVTSG